MSLSPGTRLGPYEVLQRVGAGGMGEVYRAHDPRLNWDVAVKVLLGEHTTRADFRGGFEREAHALSRFSPPNICKVYDFGTHDDQHFLVMEYLEGETLAIRLRRGPLRLDDFFACALQLADALTEAHRRGHTHRDLKPENVMLTRTGFVRCPGRICGCPEHLSMADARRPTRFTADRRNSSRRRMDRVCFGRVGPS
jgi:eukaryotic-like serine/threonine-protein kinase